MNGSMFRTEHEFTLPLGYLDAEGGLHRRGTMRLATAADEIQPLRDPRVQQNPAYLTVILLSRVITSLEGVEPVTPQVVEGLFAADLAHLQDLYNEAVTLRNLAASHLAQGDKRSAEDCTRLAASVLGQPMPFTLSTAES